MAYQPQGPVYNPPQQQIVTVSSGNPNIQAHYNSTGSRRTGWIQLVCGCICILLGIVAIFMGCYMSGKYFPIWSGLLFFLTPGIAGIMAAKSRTSCVITCFLVLSIFAALFSFCLIWVMLGAAVSEASFKPCKNIQECSYGYCSVKKVCTRNDNYIVTFMVLSIFASIFSFCLVWVMLSASLWYTIPRNCSTIKEECLDNDINCLVSSSCTRTDGFEACIAIDVIILFTALVEFIVSIISASICCRGLCCRGSTKQSTTYTTVSQQVPPSTASMQAPAAAYSVQPSAPAPYPAGYPPPQGPAYPPEAYGGKPTMSYPDATAPSAPALDQPPSYEQSVSS